MVGCKWLLVWKGLPALTLLVALILVSFAVPEGSDAVRAATYALVAAGALFVGLVEAPGELQPLVGLIQRLTGGLASFLTAWYWVLSAGGIGSVMHRGLVIAVLLVLLVALLTPVVHWRRSFDRRGRLAGVKPQSEHRRGPVANITRSLSA